MIILLSGSAGTGKSTVAKDVAKKFKLRHISSGDLMRQISVKNGFDSDGEGFLRFHEYIKKHPEIDKELDSLMIKELNKGNCVSDSRLMPYLYKDKAFKILLKVPDEVAAKRNSLRENTPLSETIKTLKERNEQNNKRYKKLYNIDVNDLSVYDLVLDTRHFSIK
ncbi:MAG TPA: nucleoside monophosphate kinase, partial [Candidatus Nanoarchaeia archaeon]|nr:nucleoside monophosphate kinase [Candidatus Nanoarchaeia archaeon]